MYFRFIIIVSIIIVIIIIIIIIIIITIITIIITIITIQRVYARILDLWQHRHQRHLPIVDILEPCTPVSNKDEATSHRAVTSSIWKPCLQQMVSVQSVHCKNNQNKILICIHFWTPTWNVWRILISKKNKSRWPHIFRLQPLAFRKYMASICSLIPLPTTPNLPSVGLLFSQTVFGVLRPGRTDCNYTWTTCALHQDCLLYIEMILFFCDPPNDCTMRCSTPVVFRSEGCIAGDEETPPVKAMSPRSRMAITTQRKVEGHNNCEARDAS